MILDGQPMAARRTRALRFDPWILVAVLGLLALGLVMVYSASAVAAQSKFGDGLYYLKRQVMAAGVGVAALMTTLQLGYKRLRSVAFGACLEFRPQRSVGRHARHTPAFYQRPEVLPRSTDEDRLLSTRP